MRLALSLALASLASNPIQQVPVKTETLQADAAKPIYTPRLRVTARHAQDALFERWGAALVDGRPGKELGWD